MENAFRTQIPKKDFNSVCRLISRDGVSYFSSGEDVLLDYSLVDTVDQSLRLLIYLLSKTDCKVRTFYSGFFYTKDSLKVLWNKIKREEKLIRKEGIILTRQDKTQVTYHDEDYRVFWPSYEAFSAEYNNEASIAWLSIEIPEKQSHHINAFKNQTRLFDPIVKIEHVKINEYERFTFSFDIREEQSHVSQWRRITESVMSVLNQEPKSLEAFDLAAQ